MVKHYEIILSIRPLDEHGDVCATTGNAHVQCEPEDLGLLSVNAEEFCRRFLVVMATAAWMHVETGE